VRGNRFQAKPHIEVNRGPIRFQGVLGKPAADKRMFRESRRLERRSRR